mmetsp:Transcript_22807/g.29546  ORF Transcript_22807/g.29546 Transcript_22807/m.29546 type:complete len:198 (+) Transcript_22807:156-749(+)
MQKKEKARTTVKKRKKTKAARWTKHATEAKWTAKHIEIKKSRIEMAGGGAFLTAAVPRGWCLGFYQGVRTTKARRESDSFNPHYWFESGEPGGRDASDKNGCLIVDSVNIDVNNYSAEDWKNLAHPGIWSGTTSNWTRFVNHAAGNHLNVSVCATSERFGRSHALYAKRNIAAGEELYFSYGKAFWRSIGFQPQQPK